LWRVARAVVLDAARCARMCRAARRSDRSRRGPLSSCVLSRTSPGATPTPRRVGVPLSSPARDTTRSTPPTRNSRTRSGPGLSVKKWSQPGSNRRPPACKGTLRGCRRTRVDRNACSDRELRWSTSRRGRPHGLCCSLSVPHREARLLLPIFGRTTEKRERRRGPFTSTTVRRRPTREPAIAPRDGSFRRQSGGCECRGHRRGLNTHP
jgi:hypothetical protein